MSRYPLQGVFTFSVVSYKPVTYMEYEYPWWGEVIGICMALSVMLVIPIYAIYIFIATPGSFRHVSRHDDIEMLSTLLAICEGNPPVTGGFHSQMGQ